MFVSSCHCVRSSSSSSLASAGRRTTAFAGRPAGGTKTIACPIGTSPNAIGGPALLPIPLTPRLDPVPSRKRFGTASGFGGMLHGSAANGVPALHFRSPGPAPRRQPGIRRFGAFALATGPRRPSGLSARGRPSGSALHPVIAPHDRPEGLSALYPSASAACIDFRRSVDRYVRKSPGLVPFAHRLRSHGCIGDGPTPSVPSSPSVAAGFLAAPVSVVRWYPSGEPCDFSRRPSSGYQWMLSRSASRTNSEIRVGACG